MNVLSIQIISTKYKKAMEIKESEMWCESDSTQLVKALNTASMNMEIYSVVAVLPIFSPYQRLMMLFLFIGFPWEKQRGWFLGQADFICWTGFFSLKHCHLTFKVVMNVCVSKKEKETRLGFRHTHDIYITKDRLVHMRISDTNVLELLI